MSSPIANSTPTTLQRLLVGFHQLSAHTNRIGKLSAAIGTCISEQFSAVEGPILALDVGCGDMTMAETLAADNPRLCWTCTDIHELPPHLRSTEKWKNYRRFDGANLPFENESFDLILFSDVLHHCYPNALQLLREAGLKIAKMNHGLNLYPFPLSVFLRPSLQFIAVLEKA